jgi:hypothetical protein
MNVNMTCTPPLVSTVSSLHIKSVPLPKDRVVRVTVFLNVDLVILSSFYDLSSFSFNSSFSHLIC